MRRHARMLLAVGLLMAAAARQARATDKDVDGIQGAWVPLSIQIDGRQLDKDELGEIKMRIKGNRYTVTNGTQVADQGSFKLDATRKPRAIDTMPGQGPDKGKTMPGIYELSGDTLKICVAVPGKERPGEFASKAGSDQVLYVLKRVKP
jgi:uncharacterized protein (TIGR03067 family)